MSTSEEAATAIAALDNKYVWPGMDCPMAVKWMDTQLQQRRRDQHLAAMRHRTVGPMGAPLPTMLLMSLGADLAQSLSTNRHDSSRLPWLLSCGFRAAAAARSR